MRGNSAKPVTGSPCTPCADTRESQSGYLAILLVNLLFDPLMFESVRRDAVATEKVVANVTLRDMTGADSRLALATVDQCRMRAGNRLLARYPDDDFAHG